MIGESWQCRSLRSCSIVGQLASSDIPPAAQQYGGCSVHVWVPVVGGGTKVEVEFGRLGVGQPFAVVEQLHDPSAVDVQSSLEWRRSTQADAHRWGGDQRGQRAGDVAAVGDARWSAEPAPSQGRPTGPAPEPPTPTRAQRPTLCMTCLVRE
jgi:hypothetical protein